MEHCPVQWGSKTKALFLGTGSRSGSNIHVHATVQKRMHDFERIRVFVTALAGQGYGHMKRGSAFRIHKGRISAKLQQHPDQSVIQCA